MKRIIAIAVSIALVFAMTSCNNQTSMEKKTTPNPENAAKAQQFIKDAGSTYYLATAETNGQAHVRAFGTADIFEGKLYIQTGKVKNVYKQLIAMAMRSAAKDCIIPAQDWLGLDNTSRMNAPGTVGVNWSWRLAPGQITDELAEEILIITKRFGRANWDALNRLEKAKKQAATV